MHTEATPAIHDGVTSSLQDQDHWSRERGTIRWLQEGHAGGYLNFGRWTEGWDRGLGHCQPVDHEDLLPKKMKKSGD